MNTANPELEQALEQWARMHRALASLRADVESPEWFEVLAQGPREDLRRLERTIRRLSGSSGARHVRHRIRRVDAQVGAGDSRRG